MDTITAIEPRRAIKQFDLGYKMTEGAITQFMSLAILPSTSFNIQNWRFVLVANGALRKKIRAVAWDQAQVTDASLLIVLYADLKAREKNPERYWKDAPKEARDFLVPAIDWVSSREGSGAERRGHALLRHRGANHHAGGEGDGL